MNKNKIKLGTYIYPLPVVIVGANVESKANFMIVAWCSVVERTPPMISLSCDEKHYTNIGIKKNKVFSVNIPSEELVEKVDFIGTNSGNEIDKSGIFDVFFGDIKDVPMIREAPVNMECKLIKTIQTGKGHEIFIGEVVAAYAEDRFFTESVLDITKIKPLLYSTGERKYLRIGEVIGTAFSIGKNYMKKSH
ncbi:MAG: flavin reductase family protein [Promethearchaeota archaeon]